MTTYRLLVGRDTPDTGDFQWAEVDARQSKVRGGEANLRLPPFKGSCEVILRHDLVLLERLAVPKALQRRLGARLQFAAEELVSEAPERLHVAPGAREAGGDTLPVGIVDRLWLERLVGQLQRAGLSPRCAWPESLLPRLVPGHWTVVWANDGGFLRCGGLEACALDLAGEEPPVALCLALDRARADGTAHERVVVRPAQSEAALPDLESWTRRLGVPVEREEAFAWYAPEEAPRLDLLQGTLATGGGRWSARLRRTSALAGGLVALFSAFMAVDWASQVRERDGLAAEMRSLYRETFGDKAVVVDPALQMSRALADLRAQAGQAAPGDFLVLLQAASRYVIPPGQPMERMEYDAGVLMLAWRSPAAPALLDEIRARARASGLDVRFDHQGTGAERVTQATVRPALP